MAKPIAFVPLKFRSLSVIFCRRLFLRRSDLRRYFLRNRCNFQRKHVKKGRNSKRFPRKRIAFGKLTLIVNVQLLLILFFSFVLLFLCLFIGGFFWYNRKIITKNFNVMFLSAFLSKTGGVRKGVTYQPK